MAKYAMTVKFLHTWFQITSVLKSLRISKLGKMHTFKFDKIVHKTIKQFVMNPVHPA